MEGHAPRRTALRKSLGILSLLAWASTAFLSRTFDPSAAGDSNPYREGYSLAQEAAQRHLEVLAGVDEQPHLSEFTVCGRPIDTADEPATNAARRETYATCPPDDPSAPMLVLMGYKTYGRTANQLRSFVNAVQYARDEGLQLGIMRNSWAMELLLQFFLADDAAMDSAAGGAIGGGWEARVEDALCAKTLHSPTELAARDRVALPNPAELFYYRSPSSEEDYAASQSHLLRTLFRNHNTGHGPGNYTFQTRDNDALPVSAGDMCTGLDALFDEEKSTAIFTVVHMRHLEGDPGKRILAAVSLSTGCDPTAALEMSPEYVKSILAPLGMLEHPIVIITDGQRPHLVQRLMGDPDIGKHVRVVPEGSNWLGGDITLATTATAFIGNPASTLSWFIARSRRALGLGDTFLYMAKDDASGEYASVCGDECLFSRGQQKDSAFLYVAASQMNDKRHARPFRRADLAQWYRSKAGTEGTGTRKKYHHGPRLTAEEWQRRREAQAVLAEKVRSYVPPWVEIL